VILDEHALVHIYAGTCEVVHGDRSVVFGPGSTVIFPRNQLGRLVKMPDSNGEPFRSVSVLFPNEVLRRFYEKRPLNPAESKRTEYVDVHFHPMIDGFFQSLIPYFDLTDELPGELAAIKIEECLVLLDRFDPRVRLILAALNEPGKVDLAEFMERNFMFNLPLEKFSYLTGRSLTTFKKDFRQTFSLTPGRWLLRKRLEWAHYQLAVAGRKPVDVYLDAGFENLAHFSFVFKRQYGYNPTEVREDGRDYPGGVHTRTTD
jgi:AraC-like DNA-binding protein